MNCCKYSRAWINQSVKHHLSNLSRQASLWNDVYQEMIAFGVLNVELCSLGAVIVTPLVLQSCASALIFIAFQMSRSVGHFKHLELLLLSRKNHLSACYCSSGMVESFSFITFWIRCYEFPFLAPFIFFNN